MFRPISFFSDKSKVDIQGHIDSKLYSLPCKRETTKFIQIVNEKLSKKLTLEETQAISLEILNSKNPCKELKKFYIIEQYL